jgi:YD repeat-containing protein
MKLVEPDTPLGSYEFAYDANGPPCARVLAEVRRRGRRVRESGAGLRRRYRWDELGRLTEVAASDGQDARGIEVVIDAVGELASVDGTPLLWDSAHPLGPLAWNGKASILGEDGPRALAGHKGRIGHHDHTHFIGQT